jgi:hypothetical protein
MQIPPIESFRQDSRTPNGKTWDADPEGAAFTLKLPDGEPVWEEGGWDARPDEPSYQMALAVVPQADSLKDEALAFLAGIVDFGKLALEGEPFVIGILCDARTQRVIFEMEWTKELYCRFSVTFSWRMNHPQLPDHRSPVGMAFWAR